VSRSRNRRQTSTGLVKSRRQAELRTVDVDHGPDSYQRLAAAGVATNRNGVMVAHGFSGPIPPPEVLAAYSKDGNDFAERIVVMAERQAEHRQAIEKSSVRAGIGRGYLGQVFGFIVALVAMALSAFAFYRGFSWEGAAVSGVTLTGLVSVFVYGSRHKQQTLSLPASDTPQRTRGR
jgi:uncharacterized membrane protein